VLSDVEKEGTTPCHKSQSGGVPVEVATNKPVAKPGPIRAEIALRDGSMLRCAILARSMPFTKAFGLKLEVLSVLSCLSMPNPGDHRDVPFSIDELKIWNYDKTDFRTE
jgi:hypothetical protein